MTPLISSPDGSLTSNLLFSTTLGSRFFTGSVDPNAVQMQVSIRGGAWSTDSNLISFDSGSWIVPNPEAYPDGLDLQLGLNTLQIRSIAVNGQLSNPASIEVTYLRNSTLIAETLTNVQIEQKDRSVVLSVEGSQNRYFRGINVYASVYPGGGTTGYIRINPSVIVSGEELEDVREISTVDITSDVQKNPDGSAIADPLFYQLIGQQVDTDNQIFSTDFTERIEIPEYVDTVRTYTTLSGIRTYTQYSYEHNRNNNERSTPATVFINAFAALKTTEPLYYVLTGVYYNPVSLLEYESPVSAEVVGHPLQVTTTLGSYPSVSRRQIVVSTTEAILRSNPQIKVEPGSYTRDVFIDPFSSEAERIRFLIDFFQRARSFSSLNQIDDPSNTGVSSSVGTSAYKQALKKAFYLSSDADVQSLIDSCYESLAGNLGVFREGGIQARGVVLFYTTKKPTQTILIPLGTVLAAGSIQFRTTQAASIPLDSLASYYNPINRRYQVSVSVQALDSGVAGNVAVGQIKRIVSSVPGMSVVNTGRTFGGRDTQSNQELAGTAMNKLASVDTGTARGIYQIAAGVAGVTKANVVASGNSFMFRDLDANGVHKGGKVDVWVQGDDSALTNFTDTFAFAFDVAKDIQFVLQGDPSDLIFKAIDPSLSVSLPIVEMLDNPAAGYEFKNATSGMIFDLSNVTLLSYDTIQLDTGIAQPSVTLSDVVIGDYRRRTGNQYVPKHQPVSSAVSVTGTVNGDITDYTLTHTQSPLILGRSIHAEDAIAINNLASSDPIVVTDEAHVLVGEYVSYLDNLGGNPLTIIVTSADGLTTYNGPETSLPDYTIIAAPNETTAVAIKRIPSGQIASGDSVLVSYQHDENFTVEYTVNSIVEIVQEDIDARKHITADILVKEAIPQSINISATVILKIGSSQSNADTSIRSAIGNFFETKTLSNPVRQSDIIRLIEEVAEVSYVIVPLTQLARAADSFILQESIGIDSLYTSLSTSTVSVWLLTDALTSNTENGGGAGYVSVMQDTTELALTPQISSGVGQAYIIGVDGLSIPGYSDDVTLAGQGYTAQEIPQIRANLTGNRILVSTLPSDSPAEHSYAVTYHSVIDTRVYDIDPGQAEHLVLGDLELTYTEDVE